MERDRIASCGRITEQRPWKKLLRNTFAISSSSSLSLCRVHPHQELHTCCIQLHQVFFKVTGTLSLKKCTKSGAPILEKWSWCGLRILPKAPVVCADEKKFQKKKKSHTHSLTQYFCQKKITKRTPPEAPIVYLLKICVSKNHL